MSSKRVAMLPQSGLSQEEACEKPEFKPAGPKARLPKVSQATPQPLNARRMHLNPQHCMEDTFSITHDVELSKAQLDL